MKNIFAVVGLVAVFGLAGCGGGGGAFDGIGSGGGSAVPAVPVVPPLPLLTVELVEDGSVTSVVAGNNVQARAILKTAEGVPIPNVVVSFSTDAAFATILPVSATALTDATGVAMVSLVPVAAGAATITATSQVVDDVVSGSVGYATNGATIGVSVPIFGVGTAALSAFGSTDVSVTVTANGVAVEDAQVVSFSSFCAAAGLATLTPSVATVNGVATASYMDKGCAGLDTVMVVVVGAASSSGALLVSPPSASAISFVSATPVNISLKEKGGVGFSESSQVLFKLVGANGEVVGGKTVEFSLSTSAGGLTLSSLTGVSDPATGIAMVGVNSGSVSTAFRVIAKICSNYSSPCTGTVLTTQSSEMLVTTSIPEESNFSMSVSSLNVEGWDYDGATSVLSVEARDHFGYPVPEGGVVNFLSEGGRMEAVCTTGSGQSAGVCSALFTSYAPRPSNGRISVLAHMSGEEGFTDFNGNGMADVPADMADINGDSTDVGEAFVDGDENGIYNSSLEKLVDINGSGFYDGPDHGYNGVLCDNEVAPGASFVACSLQNRVSVREQAVIVLSTSAADIKVNGGADIALPQCSAASGTLGAGLAFNVVVVDLHGNAMPVGTTVDFSTTNGTLVSAGRYVVPNSSGCRTGYAGCPVAAGSATFGNIAVELKSDATLTAAVAGDAVAVPPVVAVPAACVNAVASGEFTVRVTTPRGVVTSGSVRVTD